MKNKLILILFVLLIIIILVSFFSAQQGMKTTSLPQNAPVQNEQITNEARLPAARTLLPHRAITIIKVPRPPKESKALPTFSVKESVRESLRDSSPSEGGAPNSQAGQVSSETQEAGITKIDKPPTPTEREEMRSKGIVIY